MKSANLTVSFSRTVTVQIDETRLDDEDYLDEIRDKASAEAKNDLFHLERESGVVTDCQEFPEFIE